MLIISKEIRLSFDINDEQFSIQRKTISRISLDFYFLLIILFLAHQLKNASCHYSSFSLCLLYSSTSVLFFFTYSIVFSVISMNVFTQFATQFLINKNTLAQLFKALKFSNEFINEFRNDHIFLDEDIIRRKIRLLCDLTQDESFQDLLCHDNGIQLIFHTTPHEYRFMRFRVSFDIKLIAIILNHEQQAIQFLISNIQIKSLNHISKPFRFCVQVNTRLVKF